MKNLPFWHLTNKQPSFLDVDSKTAVEMVGRVYGAMQELITEYNNLAEQLSKSINDFETGVNKDIDEFKTCITSITENFINIVDEKLTRFENNIDDVAKEEIIKIINSGNIQAVGDYDETTESLNIVLNYKENE